MGMSGGAGFKYGKKRPPSFKRIGSASAGETPSEISGCDSPLGALNAVASGGGLGGFLSFCLPGFGRG